MPASARTIFIQTATTPNPDALKFLPDREVVPASLGVTYVEYINARATLATYPSPLASQLMGVDGVRSVFFGPDFITVTKSEDSDWAYIKPEIFSLITAAVNTGGALVSVAGDRSAADSEDSLAYNENDSEVVGMIKELLDTRIRPAIQDDGGDIDFKGFEDGVVFLKLRGACRTCDSSVTTLKSGIEAMLMHYIEEVKEVRQVIDPEEEVSNSEFAKFEQKLKEAREAA